MPVKILLADKSITIQKVVEMLFSGKDYEVACVSDGETALAEASRVVPNVVLADVDLPRIDGYSLSAQLKKMPALAQTPVILMMSRDDVFDSARAGQASIVDHIAKPFESQELISKVKKAAGGGPARAAEPASAVATPARKAPIPAAPPSPAPAAAAPKAKPKQAAPPDIFDIIQEAPSQADIKTQKEEGVYEVEPVVEVEEQLEQEGAKALPVGKEAVEEMRKGLGLTGATEPPPQDVAAFDSFSAPTEEAREYVPPSAVQPRRDAKTILETEAREYVPPPPEPEEEEATAAAPADSRLRSMTEEIVSRIAREHFKSMGTSRAPEVSRESVQSAVEQSVSKIVRETAREVIEKVAWEVIPDLAAMMIREEIEKLKAEP